MDEEHISLCPLDWPWTQDLPASVRLQVCNAPIVLVAYANMLWHSAVNFQWPLGPRKKYRSFSKPRKLAMMWTLCCDLTPPSNCLDLEGIWTDYPRSAVESTMSNMVLQRHRCNHCLTGWTWQCCPVGSPEHPCRFFSISTEYSELKAQGLGVGRMVLSWNLVVWQWSSTGILKCLLPSLAELEKGKD